MKNNDRALARMLTYMGTLPLVGCVALIFAPITGLDSPVVASAYAAVIVSFLCGIHWAVFLFFSEKSPTNLLVTSNSVALVAWGSVLVTHHAIAFVLQALCFLTVFMLDFKLHRADILPEWFY
ncbi:MAG: DUF3429 domain-containing protein, partial [Arenimonas sp.]